MLLMLQHDDLLQNEKQRARTDSELRSPSVCVRSQRVTNRLYGIQAKVMKALQFCQLTVQLCYSAVLLQYGMLHSVIGYLSLLCAEVQRHQIVWNTTANSSCKYI
jgi:hypothetical protein